MVYGALRSGTTLFRLMLYQNTRIVSPGETDFLFDHLDGETIDHSAAQDDLFYQSVIHDPDNHPQDSTAFDWMLSELRKDETKDNPALVLIHHRNLSQILERFPEAKFIHLVRDPRDVARSSTKMGWAGSTYYGIDHWLKTEVDWSKQAARLRPKQVLTIHYEDLVQSPEATLSAVCDFIGVSFESFMLEYDKTSTYSKPDKSLVYQWKTKQTPREVAVVEHKVGNFLTDLGYEPSGHPRVVPSAIQRIGYYFHNKYVTWHIRIKRYGLVDPVIEATSRRLNWPELDKKSKARREEKRNKYLK